MVGALWFTSYWYERLSAFWASKTCHNLSTPQWRIQIHVCSSQRQANEKILLPNGVGRCRYLWRRRAINTLHFAYFAHSFTMWKRGNSDEASKPLVNKDDDKEKKSFSSVVKSFTDKFSTNTKSYPEKEGYQKFKQMWKFIKNKYMIDANVCFFYKKEKWRDKGFSY